MIVNHSIPAELKRFCMQSHSQHHASCIMCIMFYCLELASDWFLHFHLVLQLCSSAVYISHTCGITLQIKATFKEGEREYFVFKTNITQNYSFKVNSKRNIPWASPLQHTNLTYCFVLSMLSAYAHLLTKGDMIHRKFARGHDEQFYKIYFFLSS